VRADLPKSPVGKLLKRDLVDEEARRRAAAADAAEATSAR
jgi:hypothetical protein